MKRYSKLPITLYRCQNQFSPKLREKGEQSKLNRSAFDFIFRQDDLYHPTQDNIFKGPNGISLRPLSIELKRFLQSFKGNYIFELPIGLKLPQNLTVIHERSNHYSLQTMVPIKRQDFLKSVQNLLGDQKQLTTEQLMEKIREIGII